MVASRDGAATLKLPNKAVMASLLAAVSLVLFGLSVQPSSAGAAASSDAASIGAQLFASQVETVGVEQYSTTFAGAVYQSNGTVTVYVAGSDPAFLQEVTTLDSGNYQYSVVTVPLNYTQLQNEAVSVATGFQQFQSSGLRPVEFNPDPVTGQIDVWLASPTPSDLTQLGSALPAATGLSTAMSAITGATYLGAAAQLVTNTFGNHVNVQSSYGNETVPVASRSNDSQPWTGGDEIRGPNTCTSGFAVKGLASGDTFILTAGHCASGSWYTGTSNGFIGNTSNGGIHYLDGTGHDYQTILTGGGATGRVWYTNSSYHPIIGSLIPAVGAQVTFDGAVTGEVPGNTVTANNALVDIYDGNGNYLGFVEYQVKATTTTTPMCQFGDSGGPIYQRISGTSSVYAVGIINTCLIDPNGVLTGTAGSGERIGAVMSASNSSLILGS